jgi:hypothetical protein
LLTIFLSNAKLEFRHVLSDLPRISLFFSWSDEFISKLWLLVPKILSLKVVSVSVLTWFIRCIYYCDLQFLNNAIIILRFILKSATVTYTWMRLTLVLVRLTILLLTIFLSNAKLEFRHVLSDRPRISLDCSFFIDLRYSLTFIIFSKLLI